MAELVFGLANAVGDFGDFLFKGYLGLAIALRAHCLVEAVVKLGHAALEIAHLGITARQILALLKALADINEAPVHVGQRPHIRALGDAG